MDQKTNSATQEVSGALKILRSRFKDGTWRDILSDWKWICGPWPWEYEANV